MALMFGLDAGIIALSIPVLALAIPIVAILTQHQQKMANILSNQRGNTSDGAVDALRREVAELKEIVHQQSIAIDNLANYAGRTGGIDSRVRDRVG